MAIDARIALGGIGPQIDDPLTVQAKQAKLRDLMAQQQMQTMQMEDAQRQRQETMTLNELYRSTGGDSVKIREGLASGGLGSRIPAFDEQQAKLGKVQSEGESAKLRVAKERIDLMAGELSALLARPDLSPQHVIDSLTGLVQRGIIPPEQGAQIARSIPNDPNALRAMLKQSGLQAMEASRRMEMLTPKIDYKQTGKALVPVDTNAFTNPTPQTLRMTTTPGEDMSDARMRAEGAANRGVSIRGQNLTDARARDTNQTSRELLTQERQMKVEGLNRQKDASISSAANQIAVIDKALEHPGRETATGVSGAVDPRNYVPGTNATDFRAVLDQLSGSAFLQAFESLKGGGAITEVEGKKATDAIARLQRTQSDVEFERSLKDLRKVMTDGYKRLSGNEYQNPAPSNPKKASGKVSDAPKLGATQDGYVYKGGDPADPKSWAKK